MNIAAAKMIWFTLLQGTILFLSGCNTPPTETERSQIWKDYETQIQEKGFMISIKSGIEAPMQVSLTKVQHIKSSLQYQLISPYHQPLTDSSGQTYIAGTIDDPGFYEFSGYPVLSNKMVHKYISKNVLWLERGSVFQIEYNKDTELYTVQNGNTENEVLSKLQRQLNKVEQYIMNANLRLYDYANPITNSIVRDSLEKIVNPAYKLSKSKELIYPIVNSTSTSWLKVYLLNRIGPISYANSDLYWKASEELTAEDLKTEFLWEFSEHMCNLKKAWGFQALGEPISIQDELIAFSGRPIDFNGLRGQPTLLYFFSPGDLNKKRVKEISRIKSRLSAENKLLNVVSIYIPHDPYNTSLDTSAIMQDYEISWNKHVFDHQKSPPVTGLRMNFNISQIPFINRYIHTNYTNQFSHRSNVSACYVLDEDLKIVAKDLYGEELEAKLREITKPME